MADMRQNQRQRRAVAEPDDSGDRRRQRVRRLALVVAVGFAIVGGFQLSLVAGAPWGAAANGGANPGPLPSGLRTSSVLAASSWLLAGLTALARGGLASPVAQSFSRRALRVLTWLPAIGFVMNVASSSPWERFGWTPPALGPTLGSLRLSFRGRRRASGHRQGTGNSTVQPVGAPARSAAVRLRAPSDPTPLSWRSER